MLWNTGWWKLCIGGGTGSAEAGGAAGMCDAMTVERRGEAPGGDTTRAAVRPRRTETTRTPTAPRREGKTRVDLGISGTSGATGTVLLAVIAWIGALLMGGLVTAHYRVRGLYRNGLLERDRLGPVLRNALAEDRRFQVTISTLHLVMTMLGCFAWGLLLARSWSGPLSRWLPVQWLMVIEEMGRPCFRESALISSMSSSVVEPFRAPSPRMESSTTS